MLFLPHPFHAMLCCCLLPVGNNQRSVLKWMGGGGVWIVLFSEVTQFEDSVSMILSSIVTCVRSDLSVRQTNTVKPCFANIRLIRTPHYYGQFALSPSKESPYLFSKSNLLNTDIPLIRTLSMAPSMSYLTL